MSQQVYNDFVAFRSIRMKETSQPLHCCACVLSILCYLNGFSNTAYGGDQDSRIAALQLGLTQSQMQARDVRYIYHYKTAITTTSKDLSRDALHKEIFREGTMTVTRQGRLIHVTRYGTTNFSDHVQIDSVRMVINEDYVAWWDTNTNQAEWYDHASIGQDRTEVKAMVASTLANNLFTYGFGFGDDELFVEPFKPLADLALKIKDESVPSNLEGITFYLSNAKFKGPQYPVVYTVDLAKGFLITKLDTFQEDNKPLHHVEVVPKATKKDGPWIPATVVDTSYASDQTKTLTLELEKAEVDPSISSGEFELAALGLPEGSLIAHRKIDNSLISLIMVKGVPIPESVYYTLKREQNRPDVAAPIRTLTVSQNRGGRMAAAVLATMGFVGLGVMAIRLYRRVLGSRCTC